MGGLASLLGSAGWSVHFLTLTCGELCGNPEVRQAEERSAAAVLGAHARFGMLPDGGVSRRAAIGVIECTLQHLAPSLVFGPVPDDTHQDHVVVSAAVQSVCWRELDLLFYEGPSTQRFQPNMVVDISSVWEEKKRALLRHNSQVGRRNLLDWAGVTSAYRSWPRHPGGKCEAFQTYQVDFELVFGFREMGSAKPFAEGANASR